MVPLIGQQYPKSCWAASMRMILASRGRRVASDDDIAAAAGAEKALTEGLNPNSADVLRAWGFTVRAPMTYSEEGIARLVESVGPLWVACDVRSPGASKSTPHIRVVHGVRDQQSPIALMVNDPSPINVGARYDEAYPAFVAKNELLGRTEQGEPSPIYIAHL